jgi:predicted transcriptional regulator
MTSSIRSFAGPTVADAMHTGIVMTDPDTPLRQVARLMAETRIHVVALAEGGQMRRPLRIVTVLDVAAAVAGDDAEMTAGQAARTELPAVRSDAPLREAAAAMVRHGVEHLVVVESRSAHAEGIISALDVAEALGE